MCKVNENLQTGSHTQQLNHALLSIPIFVPFELSKLINLETTTEASLAGAGSSVCLEIALYSAFL